MGIRVPRLSGPQVQDQAPSGVRVSNAAPIEAFGGGQSSANLTQATQALASGVRDVYVKAKNDADNLAAQEALNKLEERSDFRLKDKDTGALMRQGKDSFGALDEYGALFDKDGDEIESSLSNDTQKAMFRHAKSRMRNTFTGSIRGHIAQQTRVYDNQVTAATIDLNRNKAIENFRNPEAVEEGLTFVRAAVVSNAARAGLSPEATEAALSAELSKTHTAIVDRFISNGDDLKAKEYFDANKAGFSGSDLSRVEKVLEEGTLRGESQRKTDSIMQEAPSLSAALAKARGIEDAKLRDSVTDRVKMEFSLKDAAKREAEESLSLKATNIIEKGGTWDDIPPADKAVMPTSMRVALQNYARDKVEGKQIAGAGTEYYNLKLMAATPETRDQFLRMDLNLLRGKVKDSELKEFIDIQADARKGGKDGESKLDGFMTDIQIANDAMKEIGVKPDSDDGVAFRRRLDQEVVARQSATGKKITNEELRQIADRMSVTVVTDKRPWFLPDQKKRAFELTDEDNIETVDFENIPEKSRKEIEAALKRRGSKVTPETTKAVYAQYLRSINAK